MKVGVYIGETPPEVGGGYTFIDDVLSEIVRRGGEVSHKFVALTDGPAGSRVGDLEVISLKAAIGDVPARARERLGRSVDWLLGRPAYRSEWPRPAVDQVLNSAGIDVVWYLTPAVCWSANFPYITVVWDLQHRLQPYFPEVSAHGEGVFRDDLYRRVLPRASLVIAGTEVGRDEIQRFYGVASERIRILPHPTPGFALAAAERSASPRPAVAPPDPFLFYPAQFWPHKNHVNLLEALRLIRERDRLPVTLALSGSDQGNLAHVKEVAERLKLGDAVRWLGFVSRDDLVGLYRHALSLAYVTYFGPENLPTLEAFALGCPVIASDVAGAREQLGDAAWFVNPSSPEQIADAVRRLLAEPAERAALIERGRQRARRFTSREFVTGVLSWLDEFVAIRRCWPSARA